MLQNTPERFAAQLQEGHYNELRVALWFMLRGAHVRLGYTGQRYDLSVILDQGETFSVEVKWDKAAAATGNLYFETENTRQHAPSGVAATTAAWWCHVVGEGSEALIARLETLRALVASGSFRTVQTRGDDSNSRGVLVPRAHLDTVRCGRWIRLPTEAEFFGELFRGQAIGRR